MKSKKYNPPWQLSGDGYIIFYKFSKKEVIEKNLLEKNFSPFCLGGVGLIIIADYKKSNVGPYQEILIIPGKIKYKNKTLKTISKIFVSTDKSVFYGRKNWGIPKEKSEFIFNTNKKNTQIKVSQNNSSFFEISLNSHGPQFPITTSLMPLSLVQEYNGKRFYTQPKGSGLGRIISINNISIDKKIFPDVSKKRPLFAIKINSFKMTFPSPQTENINDN